MRSLQNLERVEQEIQDLKGEKLLAWKREVPPRFDKPSKEWTFEVENCWCPTLGREGLPKIEKRPSGLQEILLVIQIRTLLQNRA